MPKSLPGGNRSLSKVGAGAVVAFRYQVMTVVGVPAKIVREARSKRDEPVIHQEEENANTT